MYRLPGNSSASLLFFLWSHELVVAALSLSPAESSLPVVWNDSLP